MNLYIIGFSGAGKSTFAKTLAAKWQIPWLDTDTMFEERSECSIADFVEEHGWTAFREAESTILLETGKLSIASPFSISGIVACGGGVVELSANRAFLKTQKVLWLHPSWAVLYSRICKNPSAFCQDKPEAELYLEYKRRIALYREVVSVSAVSGEW